MNCEHCKDLLVDYCRGVLPPATEAGVAAHLDHCDSCAQASAALAQIYQLLDTEEVPSPQLQQAFAARLESAIRQHAAQPAPRLAAWFQTWWPSRPLGAFSYSSALLLCGLVSGQLLPFDALHTGDNVAGGNGQDIPRERLIQLCAVPPNTPANLL